MFRQHGHINIMLLSQVLNLYVLSLFCVPLNTGLLHFRLKQQNQFLSGIVHNSSLDMIGPSARVGAAMDNAFNSPLRYVGETIF